MDAEDKGGTPKNDGLRVLWYAFAFACLIGAFLLVYHVSLRHHRQWQREVCALQVSQLEQVIASHVLDRDAAPSEPVDLASLSKNGKPFLDPWGHPFVYRSRDLHFELYSIGPNGVDEGGKGDDVPAWNSP